MSYSEEIKKTIASSREFLKNISDDELEIIMQEFDDYEVECFSFYFYQGN